MSIILSIIGVSLLIIENKESKNLGILEKTLYIGVIAQLSFNEGINNVLFSFKTHQFFEGIEILTKLDKTLTQIGVKISYKIIQKVTRLIVRFFLCSPLIVGYNVIKGRSFFTIIGEYFSFGVPLISFQAGVLLFIIYNYTIWNRFKIINKCLSDLKSEKLSKILIKQRIVLISALHQNLCKAANNFTDSLAPYLLTLYLQFIQMFTIFLLVVLKLKSLKSYISDTIGWTVLLATENLLTTLVIQLITNEVKEARKIFLVLS